MSLRRPREGFEKFQPKRLREDDCIAISMQDYNSLLKAAYELKKIRLTYPGIQTAEENIAARTHSVACLSEQPLIGLLEAKAMTLKFILTKRDIPETIEQNPSEGKTFPCSTFPK